jgi:23S rRNA pseudouridine2605 synthase
MEERLQKILARAGIGSRRACEELIGAGRVTVNGKMATIGQKADGSIDTITVDDQVIPAAEPPMYIALNKPRRVLSDLDTEDTRQNVRDLVPVKGHLFTVGRLDYDSEGLVLLTNDGQLANELTHPKFGHEKEYRVRVSKRPDEEQLNIWRRGVVMEDGYRTMPAKVTVETLTDKSAWLRIILQEGKKRQIREVGARIGLPVQRLIRVRIQTLLLGSLKPGEWRYLKPAEIDRLKKEPGRPLKRQTRTRRSRR